jgi:hypothetical protein
MSKKDVDCVMIGNNKYVHKSCQALEEKREKTDKEQLEEYIKELFNTTYIDPRVRNQIKKFVEEYNYTYSGIRKALIYHYEIKGGDKSKANGGIGIVPFVYQEAWNYYYTLYLAEVANSIEDIENYTIKTQEITIPSPRIEVTPPKLFNMDKWEEADVN